MNKDTWIGIIGCVVLVAAMVGVFTYERANAAPAGSATDASTNATAALTASGTVQIGESDVKTINVTQADARTVTFHVTWQATNGKDTLRVTVAPPEGSTIPEGGEDTKDTGEITITVNVPEGTSSAGSWSVKVEFTTATPDPLPGGIPPPTPPPGSTDTSVSFDIAARIG